MSNYPNGCDTLYEYFLEKKISALEEENKNLRQQRDAANAQLDFILEKLSNESTRNSGKGS